MPTKKILKLPVSLITKIPVYVYTDPTRIRQILVNLLGNAIKFTSVGEVALRVTLNQFSSIDQGSCTFEIIDTGIGIDPQQIEALFNSFSQADASTTRKYGGTIRTGFIDQ